MTLSEYTKRMINGWGVLFHLYFRTRPAMYKSYRTQGAGRFESYNTPRRIMRPTIKEIRKETVQYTLFWPVMAVLWACKRVIDTVGIGNFIFGQAFLVGLGGWFLAGRPGDLVEASIWLLGVPTLDIVLLMVWAGSKSEIE